ncbi:MAG TPA: hypothetical protein VD996_17955 [Chitinophagaceae bacterium]|nr:hypothetical protein [Chitinophagaceae bacterium]
MQDRQQQENANPEKLAITDEQQRTTAKEGNQQPQQLPTGNERDEKANTEGAQAGMGE